MLENLDEAVIRTGRFDKKIEINKPTFKERKEILLKMAEKGEVSRPAKGFINTLATMTDDCTCSDLNAMFNTALRRTIFSNRRKVTLDDFKKALEEIKFEQQRKARNYVEIMQASSMAGSEAKASDTKEV